MLLIFIKYYLILLSSLAIFYASGSLLFKLLKIKSNEYYFDSFSKLLIGLLLFVICISIYSTSGLTISLGYFIIGSGALIILRTKKQNAQQFELTREQKIPGSSYLKNLLELSIVALLIFSFRYWSIYSSTGIPATLSGDYVYYSNLTDFLLASGKENSSINYPFINDLGPSPYHYFDLWVNAGIKFIFHSNAGLGLLLITYSTGAIISWFGIFAIFSHLKINSFKYKITCFILLFSMGVFLNFLSTVAPFMNNIGVFSCSIFTYSKLFPIYLFLILATLCFIKNNYNLGLLSLLVLPLASISTFFGIIPGVLIFPLAYKKLTKRNDINTPVIITCALILPVFIYVFYKIGGENTLTHIPSKASDIIKEFKLFNIKTSINIIGATFIQIFALYLPILLILFLLILTLKIKIVLFIKNHPFILLFACIIIFSLLGWACLYFLLASVQIFSNISDVLLNISSILIIVAALKYSNKKYLIASIVISGIALSSNIYYTYRLNNFKSNISSDYLKKIHSIMPQLSQIGGFIIAKSDYKNINFSYVSNLAILGPYLIYSENPTFPLTLSSFDFEFSSDKNSESRERAVIAATPFLQYVELQKKQKKFSSILNSQLDFIHAYKINYLILSKNVKLDTLISKNVKHEILDSITGERFLLLK